MQPRYARKHALVYYPKVSAWTAHNGILPHYRKGKQKKGGYG